MDAKILLVEDDAEIADFVVRGLRRRRAFPSTAWRMATKAGNTSSKFEWDVVLLDWWLPGTDGLTLLRRFRKHNQATPVLFLTAREAVSDRVTGLDSGADDYLCKPFAFAELLARIRVMMPPAGSAEDVVFVGRCESRPGDSACRASWASTQFDLPRRAAFGFHDTPSRRGADTRPHLRGSLGRSLPRVFQHAGSPCDGTTKKARGPWAPTIHTIRNRGYYFGEELG